MEAYLDAARRSGYPEELVNLTTAGDIERALVRIAPSERRRCLQETSLHGAHLTSPWYSAQELLAGICELATRCHVRLPLSQHRIGQSAARWAASDHRGAGGRAIPRLHLHDHKHATAKATRQPLLSASGWSGVLTTSLEPYAYNRTAKPAATSQSVHMSQLTSSLR